MLEVRVDHDNGHKEYIPFIYMGDGHWHRQRPETGNPIYNLEKARDDLVFYIHEGAKAARKAQELIEGSSRKVQADHPWYQFLSGGVHIGWSGGAYDVHNTDWAQLKRMGVEKAIIIADNDLVGMRAALQIAKRLQMDTRIVQFTDEFPPGFDLGDEFPDNMFKSMPENSKPGGPTRKYIGPSYFDCLHPGTWATDRIKGKDDKTRTVLRQHFMEYIRYVEEAEVFVHTDFPQLRESEKAFNARMTAHSHTDKLSKLVLRERTTRIEKLAYRPGVKEQLITVGGTSAFNIYRPPDIRPNPFDRLEPGDVAPFLEFLAYLIPNEADRENLCVWIATLIGRPKVRMGYGVLLASEKQGVGKSTLGNVLAQLVGPWNVSHPSESDIAGKYTGWLANKRLVQVEEIYQGHSFATANRLKSLITEKHVRVEEKYQAAYEIENWAHFFATSNSMRPLKMAESERRWFVPGVTEEVWDQAKFKELHDWLECGGLRHIANWANRYGHFVRPGDHAPATDARNRIIQDSESNAVKSLRDIAEAAIESEKPLTFTRNAAVAEAERTTREKVYESETKIGRVLVDCGMVKLVRVRIDKTKELVFGNPAAAQALKGLPEGAERNKRIRSFCVAWRDQADL